MQKIAHWFVKKVNQHRWISSVKKYTKMLTKTTGSSNFLFRICQPGVKAGKTPL